MTPLMAPHFHVILFFAILIAVTESFAQNFLKTGSLNENTQLMVVGALFYVCVSLLLYRSYKTVALGHMQLIWSCFSIIFAFTAGSLIYGERLTKCTTISIILAFLSIYVASLDFE